MVMQCCLNSIIALCLNLSSASNNSLKIPKVISVAHGILQLSQLQGDFYPTPQKTMLKLFDWFEIWYT